MPDLRDLPIGRLANFAYWRFTEGMQEADLQKFDAKLWRPPKGVAPDPRSPWSAESETASFAAFAKMIGADDGKLSSR